MFSDDGIVGDNSDMPYSEDDRMAI